jgi:hypothetical protein
MSKIFTWILEHIYEFFAGAIALIKIAIVYIIGIFLAEKDISKFLIFLMVVDVSLGTFSTIFISKNYNSITFIGGIVYKLLVFIVFGVSAIFFKLYFGWDHFVSFFLILLSYMELESIRKNLLIIFKKDVFELIKKSISGFLRFKESIKDITKKDD